MPSETTQQLEQPASTSLLWTRFANAKTASEYHGAWLGLLCGIISEARLGVLVLMSDAGRFEPVAQWPPDRPDAQKLAEILDRVVDEKTGLISELEASPDTAATYAIGYPIQVDEVLCGAVALEVHATTTEGLRGAMQQLQWGVGWVELRVRRDG